MGKLLEQATEARDFISNPANWLQCDLTDLGMDYTAEACRQAKKVCSLGALGKFGLITEDEIAMNLVESPILKLGNKVANEAFVRNGEFEEGNDAFWAYNDLHEHSEVMQLWDDLLLKVKEYEDTGEIAAG